MFEFFVYFAILLWKVMQRQFLRNGAVLGSFKLDVATVMAQQGGLLFYLCLNFRGFMYSYIIYVVSKAADGFWETEYGLVLQKGVSPEII